MQEELKIALVQSHLVWENPEQNRHNFTEKINAINEEVDIIMLPEMFTSGFTMNAKAVAETMNGDTVSWMQDMSAKTNTAIIGSIVVSENDTFYNRLLFVTPNGSLEYYDKRHTFTLAGEDKVYSKGESILITNYKGWKICPLVCYDLRFPVWARNINDYDVLLYVANWPVTRIDAWDTLLKARAIENMSYCIGVNRIGVDGVNAKYNGSSACYDVLGKKLTNIPLGEEVIEIVTLSKSHLDKYRSKLKFLADRDCFNLLK